MQESAVPQVSIRRYPANTPKPKVNLAFMFWCHVQNPLKRIFLLRPFEPSFMLPLILQGYHPKRRGTYNNRPYIFVIIIDVKLDLA